MLTHWLGYFSLEELDKRVALALLIELLLEI